MDANPAAEALLGRAEAEAFDLPERYRRLREELSRDIAPEIKRLHALRTGPHLVYALFPLLMVSGFALIWYSLNRAPAPLPLYPLGLILTALGMNSCFLVIHEAVHGILFTNPALNRWAGVFLSAFGCFSFSAYRTLHLRHHEFLGDARDPDDYANYTRSRGVIWAMHFNRLFFGVLLYVMVFPYFSMKAAAPGEKKEILQEYALLAALYGALFWALPWNAVLWGWLAPFVLANWMVNIRGFSQHGITDAADPLIASRTTLPHSFIRFFLINENFHLEHHLFPGVPGYHLARLHRLLAPRIPRRVIASSYSAFLFRFLRQSATLNEAPIGLVERRL